MQLDQKFAYWKGIPRQEIEWYPRIDESKCVGCGMCVTSCGRNVFDYDPVKQKAIVARPYQCMVGCTSCQVWCVFDAISFPDPSYVKKPNKRKGNSSTNEETTRRKIEINNFEPRVNKREGIPPSL